MTEAGQKHCGICNTTKPVSEFNRDRSRADGCQRQCRPCQRRIIRESAKRHPERKAASQREWAKRNPEQERAHWKVREAIRMGKLTRPDICEACGWAGDIHGHHEDYSKPLEVEWLCGSCHRERHGQEVRNVA